MSHALTQILFKNLTVLYLKHEIDQITDNISFVLNIPFASSIKRIYANDELLFLLKSS